MNLPITKRKSTVRNLLMIGLSLVVVWSCSILDIRKQTRIANNAGVLEGKVKVKSKQQGPIVVEYFKDDNGVLILKNNRIAAFTGYYNFSVLPGEYTVFAFIDVNGDNQFQRGQEHGNYHEGPLMFKVEANKTTEVETLVIEGEPPLPPTNVKLIIKEFDIIKNIGKVTELDDPKFTRKNYSIGMMRPIDFLEKVGGGLMMLQKYKKGEMPVLFVHGIMGGPTDLQNLINKLDKQHFQPWILYYPSGLRLGMISDYIMQAVQLLKNRHGFNEFIVIAHSIGGLVTRSFIKKYTEQFPNHAKQIKMVMTINSPMGGIPSAAVGVKNSFIVVPSWRDVATNSEFLQEIHTWDWPRNIPYHLVFSYVDGDDSDGTVSLNSQIPIKLQTEAVRMYGFNDNHVDTLNDEAFLNLFDSILAQYAK